MTRHQTHASPAALSIIADGLDYAVSHRSWELAEYYRDCLVRLARGEAAFGEREERVAVLDHERGRMEP
jgi:hypothetical protein